MSIALDNRRRVTVQRLSIVAATLWVCLILMSLFAPSTNDISPRTGDPVLKNFYAVRGDTGSIKVTMADESYTLERRGSEWVMAETGGYPVRTDRLNTLAEGLETLTWGARRTDNPERMERLGLGDPRKGGNGVLVQVFATNGALTAEMITGRRGDRLYARDAGEDVAFRAEGELPPLYTRQAWLDLDIVDIEDSAISAVRLTDSSGASIYLTREAANGSWPRPAAILCGPTGSTHWPKDWKPSPGERAAPTIRNAWSVLALVIREKAETASWCRSSRRMAP